MVESQLPKLLVAGSIPVSRSTSSSRSSDINSRQLHNLEYDRPSFSEGARVNRRTLLRNGSLAVLGLAANACAPKSAAVVTRAARRPPVVLPRVKIVVGPRDPHDDRPAPAPSRRLRAEGRQARREDPDSQLRARRRRDVAVVGHGQHGGRHGGAASGAPRGRDRWWRRRLDDRARTAAPGLRRDHLRGHAAARRHLELVAGRLHAHVGPLHRRGAHPRVDRAVPAGRGHRLPPAAVADRARVTASAGSPTTRRPTTNG